MIEDILRAIAAREADAAVAERSERRPLESIERELRGELAPQFQRLWDANNKRELLLTGRRVGKSHYKIRRNLFACAQEPGSVNPYVLPTAKSANLVIWPLAKSLALRHFPGSRIDETLKTISVPYGGTMAIGGCETEADVGKWFGMPFRRADVDECGNFPNAVLELLLDEALEPALMDYDGDLSQGGNPGRRLIGRWYDQTNPRRTDRTPLLVGDARSNPFLRYPAERYFADVIERRGWTWDHPTFRRQYLGEWVEDAAGLVIPLNASNVCHGLPTHSLAYGVLPPHLWRYSLGIDVGQVDDTALSLTAAHPLDTRDFVVHVEKHQNMLISQLAERIRHFRGLHPNVSIVLDSGGMGKQHAAELGARFGLYLKPAQKSDKYSQICLMRDGALSGRLQILDGPQCDPLREECSILSWNEDKDGWEDGPPDHALDATLYSLRDLRHHTTRAAGADRSDWVSEPDRMRMIAEGLRAVRERRSIAEATNRRRGSRRL